MNVIASAIPSFTPPFLFASKEDYLAFKAHWKDLARQKAITKEDVALRVLLLNKDPYRAMPPSANPARQGKDYFQQGGLFQSMSSLRYETVRAREHLECLAADRTPYWKLPAFAERWAKNGVSLELLASLDAAARAAQVWRS